VSAEVRITAENEEGSWDGILKPGEVMRWQGSPVQSVHWELKTRESIGFVLLGASGIALLGASRQPEGLTYAKFVLIWLAWVAILTVAYHAYSFWNRRRTFYSVTNRRAFIATRHFGVYNLKAYQTAETSVLRLVDTNPGSVYIARERVREWDSYLRQYVDRHIDVGFMNIREPRKVYDLLIALGGRWE
jgi:hypothetical protein